MIDGMITISAVLFWKSFLVRAFPVVRWVRALAYSKFNPVLIATACGEITREASRHVVDLEEVIFICTEGQIHSNVLAVMSAPI